MRVWTGRQGRYFWAVLGGESPRLVQALPVLLQGRRVMITAFDGGAFHPTDDEIRKGWERRGRAALSPPIVDAATIPAAEYDEWYVFTDSVHELGDCEIFVNYLGFSPVRCNEREWDETWDRAVLRNQEAIQARFWQQLERIAPWSYFAENEWFTFVTQSEYERDSVLKFWGEGAP